MNVEQLESKERELWEKLKTSEAALEPLKIEWGEIYRALAKERLRQEVLKEMAGTP